MRKSGITTPTPGRKSSPPRSRPVRNPQAEPSDAPPQNALKRTKKPHFLEPYRLSESARAALLECLSDHAVGDPESRELFAAAAEYGIASCRASAKGTRTTEKPSVITEPDVHPAEKPAAEPAERPAIEPTPNPSAPLSALAETARQLVRALGALGGRSREALGDRLRSSDPFDRVHDHAYLDAVSREVERIAEAAAAVLDTPPASPPVSPAAATPAPTAATHAAEPIDETARRLVLRIADAYEACFETKVGTGSGYPFIPVLRLIAENAEIALPAEDGRLLEVLPAHCRS